MSSSPKKRKLPPRPKIKLPVPGQFPGVYPQTMGYVTTPYGQTPVPLTPVSGQPTIVFPSKSSGFVFSNFKGLKDWTKSGLSVGEKSAFWLYEKVSSWSKRWFTHIFLFFVMFLYSVLGALLFAYFEGKYENTIQEEIKKERDEVIQQIRDLYKELELAKDSDKWKGSAKNHLMHYEEKLYVFLKQLNFQYTPGKTNWAFWNAVIYCSTVYTTIVVSEEPTVVAAAAAACAVAATVGLMEVDEDEARRARMERMVEDTERMELDEEEHEQRARSRPRQEEEQAPAKSRAKSPAVSRPEKKEAASSREEEPRTREAPVVKKAESPAKVREQQQPPAEEEVPQPPVKVSRKPRGEPTSEGTELRRRLGSPEAAKTRSARHLSPVSAPNDEEQPDPRSRKRVSSRHRYQNPSDEEEPAPPPVSQHHRSRRSPSQPVKKQIIPLSDDCLMEDVARAKRAYAHREPSDDYEYEDDLEEEDEEVIHPRRKRETTVRKRKTSVMHTDQEKEEISKSVNQGGGWFSWIPFFGSRKQKVDDMIEENDKKKKKKQEEEKEEDSKKGKLEKKPSKDEATSDKATIGEFFRSIAHFNAEFREFCRQNPEEVQILIELRNLCIVETIISVIICGLGGFAFRFTEGAFESFYKCGVKRVKRDFLDSLWNYSHNMKEDDWKSMARRKLMEFEEQLHAAHEAGVQTYSGQKSWTFLNAMMYCLTIISTIGYGHISPSTTTGRALTIIYAIFGIPMFLIVLADFGKLFTRVIKFLWAFVRRLYYTGSCRKVRRTVPMQEMMKGVQMVYDLATFRRPSQMSPEELQEMQRQHQQTVLSLDGNTPQPMQQPESPSTPAMSTFEIDDEFNLPISVAITILVLYIFIGATVFNMVEDWSFFESFYFVFISMSTIGFGDFVPREPLYMMLSMVYLIFGLALTSMCINVVQVMLADQFKQASQKIGASIGFHVSEEDGSLKPGPPEPVEIAEVHGTAVDDTKTKEKIAPKAKQEDDEI